MKLVQAAQAQSLRDTSSFMQGVGSVLQFVGAAVDEEFGPIIAAVGTGVSKAGTILSAFNQFIHPDSSVADVRNLSPKSKRKFKKRASLVECKMLISHSLW